MHGQQNIKIFIGVPEICSDRVREKMLRKVFGSEWDEVTRGSLEFQCEKLDDL